MVIYCQVNGNCVIMLSMEAKKSLKEWRLLKQYSRIDLAKEAGVSPTTINSIESGKASTPRSKRKIAKALGVEPSVIEW